MRRGGRAPVVVDRGGRAVPRSRIGRPGAAPGYSARPRPGYRYAYHYRRGYGYYRPRAAAGWHRHVRFAGYPRARVHGSYFYFPGFSFHAGFGRGPRVYVYGYPYSGYGWRDPYVRYGYAHVADAYTGFLRLKVRPREAEVHVDGYFMGIVDEFDGIFQRLRITEGPHRVELRHPYHEPLTLDVFIVPGETVTFEGRLIPLP